MINVSKPFLPSLEEYTSYLQGIWDRGWVTNNGPLVKELEEKIKKKLGLKHAFFCSSGTIALQIAIKALEVSGEIITTPYSYVASVNSIIWENCTPVFVDINSADFNIDAVLIESKITPHTQAILATHVYGNPCDVFAIKAIADKYRLKVIYDAAHCFSTSYNERSLLSYGDIAACSLHATKIFHSVEGGLIVTNDDALARKIYLLRQLGHEGDAYYSLGINGKNSEIHAAMGLCILPQVENIIQERKKITDWYMSLLDTAKITIPVALKGSVSNYSYFIVVFKSEELLKRVKEKLFKNEIDTRRYFYPSLNNLSFIPYQQCNISEDIASRVLALPLYTGLSKEIIEKIAALVNEELSS
jgi:dTDP-4-amino-4,6-dideoxygalactose transaminase